MSVSSISSSPSQSIAIPLEENSNSPLANDIAKISPSSEKPCTGWLPAIMFGTGVGTIASTIATATFAGVFPDHAFAWASTAAITGVFATSAIVSSLAHYGACCFKGGSSQEPKDVQQSLIDSKSAAEKNAVNAEMNELGETSSLKQNKADLPENIMDANQ